MLQSPWEFSSWGEILLVSVLLLNLYVPSSDDLLKRVKTRVERVEGVEKRE
jgi:hypothetical protein